MTSEEEDQVIIETVKKKKKDKSEDIEELDEKALGYQRVIQKYLTEYLENTLEEVTITIHNNNANNNEDNNGIKLFTSSQDFAVVRNNNIVQVRKRRYSFSDSEDERNEKLQSAAVTADWVVKQSGLFEMFSFYTGEVGKNLKTVKRKA